MLLQRPVNARVDMRERKSKMTRPLFWATALALTAILLAGANPALARGGYVTTWQGVYPDSATDDNLADVCLLCHGGSDRGTWNPYGWDVRLLMFQGQAISQAIVSAQPDDSDLDPTGSSNLDEITANSQPGWTGGNSNTIYDSNGILLTGQPPAALVAGDYDPGPANVPPTADANGPYSGTVGVAVTFDGSASTDPDGSIVSYDWDFGDGTSAVDAGATPTHIYNVDSTFNVALTVTDNAGATGVDTTTATIGLGNQPPVADANGPYTGTTGLPVTFDGSASIDPDGSIVSYDWDFGDGTIVPNAGAAPAHTYDAEGTFNVTLTVTDDAGASDSALSTATISAPGVLNLDPVALRVTKRVSLTRVKPIGIKVVIKNVGTVEGSADAAVVGVQNGVEVYNETLVVTDPVGNGRTRFDFPSYTPAAAGDILWTATVVDAVSTDLDELLATTRVVE